MTPQENYLRLQEQCGIKPGDWVMVVSTAKPDELGWDNSWDKPMYDCVGKKYQVKEIKNLMGIRLKTFEEKLTDYCFPFFVLEKVDAPVVKSIGQQYYEVLNLSKQWNEHDEEMKNHYEGIAKRYLDFIRNNLEVKP